MFDELPYFEKNSIQTKMFPTKPVNEAKADVILRDLR